MDPSVLELRLARSARWRYWIAGMSLVNVFAVATKYRYVLGPGAVIDVCVAPPSV